MPERSRGVSPAAAVPTAEVDPAVLADYVGKYEVDGRQQFRLFEYRGHLFVDTPDGREAELFALAKDRFFVRVDDVVITFVRDEASAVTGARVVMRGQELTASRAR